MGGWERVSGSKEKLINQTTALKIRSDQNIHCQGIPDSLMRELLEKAQLRLAVGPEMRDEYEKKFGLFYDQLLILRSIVQKELMNVGITVEEYDSILFFAESIAPVSS